MDNLTNEEFYRNYELTLIDQISTMNDYSYENEPNYNFFKKQKQILQQRLSYIQKKISKEYEECEEFYDINCQDDCQELSQHRV